jgi:beta-xylosidase
MSFNGDLTKVTNEGEVLPLSSVKWAQKQLWAPDAMCDSDGTCYLYFPAKDRSGIFRIGAAVSSDGPLGPFVPEDSYVDRTFSVDPSVFDDDGDKWLIWGGEWGGQLENWGAGHFDAAAQRPTSGPALRPRIAKLRDTMVDIAGDVMSVRIVDDSGRDIQATDGDKKFFEAPWIHKGPSGQYYLSYSTGVTHLIVYAVAESVVGPYRYAGKIMSPPLG